MSALKENKKALNANLTQYEQNDLVKLAAFIQEPSANIFQFRFEYTNDLFMKFENAFMYNDDKSIMKS